MIADKLAAALRDIDETCQTGINSENRAHWEAALYDAMQTAREALAEYAANEEAGVNASEDV